MMLPMMHILFMMHAYNAIYDTAYSVYTAYPAYAIYIIDFAYIIYALNFIYLFNSALQNISLQS